MRLAVVMGLALGSSALVSAQVMTYELEVTDLVNSPIATIEPGSFFKLRAFTEDVRAVPQGVFAAYLDVTFDAALASASGGVIHGPDYQSGISGTVSPGLMDEMGGFDGVTPLGAGPFLVFEHVFEATTFGILTFTADPADVSPDHDSLVFGSNDPVVPSLIVYGTVALDIATPIFLDGFESGTTANWSLTVGP